MLRRLVVAPLKHLVGPRRWAPWQQAYWTLRQKRSDRATNRRWCTPSPRISIVSEGSESPHSYWYFLEWLAAKRPRLRAEIHLDRLPCRLPPQTVLLHAWVQDPVIERCSRVHRQLRRLERECFRRAPPAAVVHPARVLSHTKRDIFSERLARVGLRTPKVIVMDAAFFTRRDELSFPIVVRRRWGHGGDVRCLKDQDGLDRWWAEARSEPGPWVAGEFVDVRSADGWYRKYRYFMAGPNGCPRHLIVSPHWEVRPAGRVRTRATREEELAFVTSPCPHYADFDAARRALEFEVAAFDYSYDANGRVVVWEVNPYPDLSSPKGEVGAYLAPVVERTYALLADFYADRAGL